MASNRGLLHHVELYVSDLQRSVEFWGWLLTELGYEPFQTWASGRSWRRGPTYIVLVQAAARQLSPPYDRRRVGLNHLAFHAGSRAEVDRLSAELGRRGIHLLYPERHPRAGGEGGYAVYFEDPDRIKIEVTAAE